MNWMPTWLTVTQIIACSSGKKTLTSFKNYQLHLKHHCIPATSSALERCFSTDGYIVNAQRSRLTDQTLEDMLLIAKCNRYFMDKSWGALQRGPGGPWPSQNFGWVGHNAFGPTNNWHVCSLILHCGQLIRRKISKICASRYQILRLKCTKFTFCWGSAPDPTGGAYSAPQTLPLLKGPNSKGMEGNGRGRKGKGEGRGEVEALEGGIWPTQKFCCGAPHGTSK